MIYIIIIIALVVIIAFARSLAKDNEEFSNQSVTEKFKPLINDLNNKVYCGGAETTILSKRSFNLYKKPSNEIIQFLYSSGGLTVKWSYKYFQKEVIKTKVLANARNLSVFEQLKFSEDLYNFIENEKEKFQASVNPDSISGSKKIEKFQSNLWTHENYVQSEDFSDPEILRNGMYIGVFEGRNSYGKEYRFTPFMIFLKNNRQVVVLEEENIEDTNSIRPGLIDMVNSDELAEDDPVKGNFMVIGNKVFVEVKGLQESQVTYEGTIMGDTINFTRKERAYDYSEAKYKTSTTFSDLPFKFISS